MISCTLNGGVGNQLFQIAATYALAKDHRDECGFDFSVRPMHQGNSPLIYRNNIFRNFKELPIGWKPTIRYKESVYEYRPIPYYNRMLLIGYFAGEKYFERWKESLMVLLRDENILNTLEAMFKPKLDNSVSLHVRRGDYLRFDKVYIILGSDYYKRALDTIESKAKVDNILVFSDDIPWCEKNMRDPRMIFIKKYPDYYDLYLMSLCTHNIVANSSFSWWGAYMNKNPDKMVCVPDKWFLSEGPKSSDYLICKNWIRL